MSEDPIFHLLEKLLFLPSTQLFLYSVESFDVFCFGQLLYEISVGRPLNHVQVNAFTSNNVNDSSFNTAVLEGNEAIPNQLPDSLSKANKLDH